MKRLKDYILENSNFAMKYTLIEYGIKLPFMKRRVSWLVFIVILAMPLILVHGYLFPEWWATEQAYNNWVTHEPASRALTVGLFYCFIIASGGLFTMNMQKKVVRLCRAWLRENLDNYREFSQEDRDILDARGIAYPK